LFDHLDALELFDRPQLSLVLIILLVIEHDGASHLILVESAFLVA
jgi:hypothetical protein